MLKTIINGGWCMVPLMICSVLCFAVILERWISLKAARIDTKAFMQRIWELVVAGKDEEAILLTESTPGPVAAILNAGLRKMEFLRSIGRSPEEVEAGAIKAMQDQGVNAVAELERYLVILASIGTLAPLFGFLGTVTGMIHAFDKIAAMGGIQPEAVASGIAEALITTAAGLIIATPAYLAYNAYTQKVQGFVLEIEESSAKLMEAVAAASVQQRTS